MYSTNPIREGKKVFNIRAEKLYRDACEYFYSKKYEQALSLLEAKHSASASRSHRAAAAPAISDYCCQPLLPVYISYWFPAQKAVLHTE